MNSGGLGDSFTKNVSTHNSNSTSRLDYNIDNIPEDDDVDILALNNLR